MTTNLGDSTWARIDGEVAIITGGSKGIGACTARTFAAAGARVAVVAQDQTKGQEVVEDLRRLGATTIFVQADIAQDDQVRQATDRVVDELGPPRILINNAALTPSTYGQPAGSAIDIDLDVWRRYLDVNLTGALLLSRHVVPTMKAAGGGSVVNVNSLVAQYPRPADVGYAASKAGLSGLTRAMALDFAPDVRVNEIITGVVLNADNARHQRLLSDDSLRGQVAGNNLTGRLGTPNDVAMLCLFLAGQRSGFLTGQSIVLDGGAHIPMRTLAPNAQGFTPSER